MMNKNLYRFDIISYAPPLDEYENSIGTGSIDVILKTFPIISFTLCGAWIDYYGRKKFVNLKAHKQFACMTLEEAKTSFIARKHRQEAILERQLDGVKESLIIISRMIL